MILKVMKLSSKRLTCEYSKALVRHVRTAVHVL
jgi:hypothetical protein